MRKEKGHGEKITNNYKRAGKFSLAACERGSRTPSALYNDANWTRISITAS